MAQILLVDDDAQIRASLGEFLKTQGHEVTVAANGKEAMKCLAEQQIDLILLDIIMPEQDGIETIMELNQKTIRPKVIAISGGSVGLSQEYILLLAKTMKVDAVLAKPVSFEVLKETMTRVLGPAPE
jgi:CheY-like chemotaxis protein